MKKLLFVLLVIIIFIIVCGKFDFVGIVDNFLGVMVVSEEEIFIVIVGDDD